VVVSTVMSFVIYQQKVSERNSNGRRIEALTEQLAIAQDDINENDDRVREELDCQHKFDIMLQNLAINYFGSLGDLVIEATDGDADPTQIPPVVTQINLRLGEYREAVATLEQWRSSIPPGACPL
jgi:hypothetical protein